MAGTGTVKVKLVKYFPLWTAGGKAEVGDSILLPGELATWLMGRDYAVLDG